MLDTYLVLCYRLLLVVLAGLLLKVLGLLLRPPPYEEQEGDGGEDGGEAEGGGEEQQEEAGGVGRRQLDHLVLGGGLVNMLRYQFGPKSVSGPEADFPTNCLQYIIILYYSR